MSGLLSSVQSAGSVLQELEKAVGVVQNNVSNASTPGYAREDVTFTGVPYQPDGGWFGGMQVSGITNARSQYAEQAVRQEFQQQGYYDQKAQCLQQVESVFDVTGDSGLGGAINNLFDAFSAWSQAPNDGTQRQNVIAAANQLAGAFNQTAADLSHTADTAVQQMGVQVDKINQLCSHLADLNRSSQSNPNNASANEPETQATLEELSQHVNFTTVQGNDGTLTVLAAGQVPLVMGDHSYALKADRAAAGPNHARPEAIVRDASGHDVTSLLTGGGLGGLLAVHNQDIAGLLGGASGTGSLNDLAMGLAQRVNDILSSGQVDNPAPPTAPTPGRPLFVINSDSTAAATLTVDPSVTPDALGAIDPGPPMSANGIPSRIAALANPTDPQDKLQNQSFVDFYGGIAASAGRLSSDAQAGQSRQTQLVSQARSMRSEISGVSLDDEAAKLIAFQRSYEATSRVVTVVNDLMTTLMGLIPQ
jgi:flagellar hook-associated protein 1 FlgK